MLAMTPESESSSPTGGGDDPGPSSEVRPAETERPCVLRVFSCLRTLDASGAWLTVSDDSGATHFEGPLGDDGLELLLQVRSGCRVCLRLEASSWHRQSQVELKGDLVEHVFA